MKITFRRRKLQRQFESQRELERAHGTQVARKIAERMTVLQHAPVLLDVPGSKPERRHELAGDRKGQYAVDVGRGLRLVFEPWHDHIPIRDDGSVDLSRITAIRILEVVDYH